MEMTYYLLRHGQLAVAGRCKAGVHSLDHVEREAANAHNDGGLPEEVEAEHKVEIKELGQKHHAQAVDGQGDDLGEHHVQVPGGDLECDHDELVHNQCGERDRDNVEELVLEEQEARQHDRTALVHANHEPGSEGLGAEAPSLGKIAVELGVKERHVLTHVPVQHETEHRCHRVHSSIADHQPPLVQLSLIHI